VPAYRIRTALELGSLRCPPHYRRLIETAWTLGYTQWAHCLGYGGHFLTKSRRFSGRIRFVYVGRTPHIPESAIMEYIEEHTVHPVTVRWHAGKVA
jgi:hypothetical protein